MDRVVDLGLARVWRKRVIDVEWDIQQHTIRRVVGVILNVYMKSLTLYCFLVRNVNPTS